MSSLKLLLVLSLFPTQGVSARVRRAAARRQDWEAASAAAYLVSSVMTGPRRAA